MSDTIPALTAPDDWSLNEAIARHAAEAAAAFRQIAESDERYRRQWPEWAGPRAVIETHAEEVAP
jgi:hypothetical protein